MEDSDALEGVFVDSEGAITEGELVNGEGAAVVDFCAAMVDCAGVVEDNAGGFIAGEGVGNFISLPKQPFIPFFFFDFFV